MNNRLKYSIILAAMFCMAAGINMLTPRWFMHHLMWIGDSMVLLFMAVNFVLLQRYFNATENKDGPKSMLISGLIGIVWLLVALDPMDCQAGPTLRLDFLIWHYLEIDLITNHPDCEDYFGISWLIVGVVYLIAQILTFRKTWIANRS